MLKSSLVSLTLVILLTEGAAVLQEGRTGEMNKLIPNFLRVEEKFCTGGQPTVEGLQYIAEQGFKSVINLRTSNEGVDLKAEEEQARRLRLNYFNIPVDPNNPKDEQAAEFLEIVKDPRNQPIFIHCGSANRVGAFWMIYRVLEEGWPLERALAEAEKIGLRNPKTRQFALDYINRHKAER